MKQLNELINNEKSAWKLVDKWLKEAINKVKSLIPSIADSERVCMIYKLQQNQL